MNQVNQDSRNNPLLSSLGIEETNHSSLGWNGKLDKKPKTAAVILAGGSGERFGRPEGKQLIVLAGNPLLTWSIAACNAVPDIGLIVVVCPADRMDEYRTEAIDPYHFLTPITVAPAGDTRQESAFSGMEYVPETYEFVLIHDGARPMITPDLVQHSLNVLKGNIDADGVVVGYPTIDTPKLVDENGIIIGTPDRKMFWSAQTPQVFRASFYRRAHASALSDGFMGTDDASLIERLGGRVLMVEGSRINTKVTVYDDYKMVTAVTEAQEFVPELG